MKPFLILQLRPEDEAADSEYASFLEKGGVQAADTHRIRLDQQMLPEDLDLSDYSGVIVGGGPGCVSDDPATKDPVEARSEASMLGLMPAIVDGDVPFLGCCYGIGILGHYAGAQVSKERYGEPVGPTTCRRTETGRKDPLLADLPEVFPALAGHKEALQDLPSGAAHLLSSDTCPFQMIRMGENVYATQFHPEADGAEFARRIRIYKDRGYFDPEEAEELTRTALSADISEAPRILQRFVERYSTISR
ncbi:MAG: glutamine amidotransferase [Pseudomonadota bacterium]